MNRVDKEEQLLINRELLRLSAQYEMMDRRLQRIEKDVVELENIASIGKGVLYAVFKVGILIAFVVSGIAWLYDRAMK